MPVISGGGFPSSGGTFTGDVTIAPNPDVNTNALTIRTHSTTAFSPLTIHDVDTNTDIAVIDQGGSTSFRGIPNSSWGSTLQFTPPNDSTASSNVFVLGVPGGTAVAFRVLGDGSYRTLCHAAPANGDLLTGEMAVWFDQTNGAAKLMVKAKTADGTVVTGSLALA